MLYCSGKHKWCLSGNRASSSDTVMHSFRGYWVHAINVQNTVQSVELSQETNLSNTIPKQPQLYTFIIKTHPLGSLLVGVTISGVGTLT